MYLTAFDIFIIIKCTYMKVNIFTLHDYMINTYKKVVIRYFMMFNIINIYINKYINNYFNEL